MSKLIKSNYVRTLDSVIRKKSMGGINEEVLDTDKEPELDDETLAIKMEILIAQAQEEAAEILRKASEESEKIINSAYEEKEDILQETYEKAQQILEENKQSGYQEGYQQGYQEGKLESDKLIEEALETKKDYYEMRNNLVLQMEAEAVDLITICNEKVMGRLLDEDKDKIIGIVKTAITEMESNTKLVVMVAEADYEILELSKNRIMAMFPLIEDIDIKKDYSLMKGDCIIEGDRGSVDASAGMQIEEMNNLIKNLLTGE